MLIRFSIENWQSFREQATFSMIAGPERQHNDRLARVKKYDLRVLPTAAIYGGNASGKTNFVKALAFVQALVVRGTQPDDLIAVEPFLLDTEAVDESCTFHFELLIDELVYDFSFSVTSRSVVEEKLVRVTSTSETTLYHRKKGKLPVLHDSLKPKDFYKFAFRGTRKNQLYLTNAVSQNVEAFRPVYDWFKNTLVLLAPDSHIQQFEYYLQEEHPLHGIMNTTLSQLDTGISRLGAEEIPFESIPAPEELLNNLKETLKEGNISRLHKRDSNERYVVSRKGNALIAQKLVAHHRRSDASEIKFELSQESSGSQRIIDLMPAFIDASSPLNKKVYVIDEVDRSLHTLLTRQLLEAFLDSRRADSRSQLIFTTHDVLLMDQQFLRRDEMWVTERDGEGRSQLFSLGEYKELRNDTDVRKRYLQGRLGGIPRILFSGDLTGTTKTAPAKSGV